MKTKQPFRPFAPIAKDMEKKATPAKKEKTKSKHFVRHGNDDPKPTIPKVKDWAFRRPVDGRAGKAERAKQVKMTNKVWTSNKLLHHLLDNRVGTPECRWTVTINMEDPKNDSPAHRPPTARDTLYLLQFLMQDYTNQRLDIEIDINENHRILHIVDNLSKIITSDSTKEPTTPLNER